MTLTPEEIGRVAIRRFVAETATKASRRLLEPPREPTPSTITHPAWFGAAWREALGAPQPDEATEA